MNHKFIKLAKNFSLVMIGNLYSLFVSTIITLIIPRFFSEETYSYFQLENLYCSYLWIFSLGWNDGYYIKYGGKNKNDLKNNNVSSLFFITFLHSLTTFILLISTTRFILLDANKRYVLMLAIISVCIEFLISSMINLLQATNCMKHYAIMTIIDRSIYLFFVIILIITHNLNFKILIFADILSKIILLFLGICFCRDFFSSKIKLNSEIFIQAKEIISIGFNVRLASYISQIINSITQFAIEQKWGLLTFGKIALTLTISNAFTKFVSAVSLALFPPLRRTGEENRIGVYNSLNIMLSVFMLIVFCFYVPMKWVLGILLPAYQESLNYIALLLPISLFETKVTMLINTYLKLIRHEKEILYSNILAVSISLIMALLSTLVLKNLYCAVLSIVLVLAVRCYFAEYRLSKFLKIQKTRYDLLLMAAMFIVSNWLIGGVMGIIIYIICLVTYLIFNRKDILSAKEYIFQIMKK